MSAESFLSADRNTYPENRRSGPRRGQRGDGGLRSPLFIADGTAHCDLVPARQHPTDRALMSDGMEAENGPSPPWIDQPTWKAPSVGSHSLASAIELMGARKWFSRNAEIYGQMDPADYCYKVVTGSVRAYKVAVDGRRQIGAFYLPGDIFGLGVQGQRLFSAEAIVEAEMLAINRNVLTALATRDNEVARDLWMLTAGELQRTQNHMLLLNKSAPERVASFLLEMAERFQSSDEVQLSMSRQDVADYLGLTSETISRMLTRFEKSAAIALPTCRQIVLRNRSVLKRLLA